MISALSRCLASCRLSGVGVDGKSDRLLYTQSFCPSEKRKKSALRFKLCGTEIMTDFSIVSGQ